MQFKAEYKAKIGEEFPTDPKEQLVGAIKAVFRSWDNPRANVYRRDMTSPTLAVSYTHLGVTQDGELTAEDLKELAGQFKAEYKEKIGADFPSDPKEQLMGAIKAVFRSWNNPRAIVYRRMNDIPGSWGTAVNVQSMAFGNMGDDLSLIHI